MSLQAATNPAASGVRHVAIASGRVHLQKGKQPETMRKTKHRGIARAAASLLKLIAYNQIRTPKTAGRLAPPHRGTP
jgi:hypothetical protein